MVASDRTRFEVFWRRKEPPFYPFPRHNRAGRLVERRKGGEGAGRIGGVGNNLAGNGEGVRRARRRVERLAETVGKRAGAVFTRKLRDTRTRTIHRLSCLCILNENQFAIHSIRYSNERCRTRERRMVASDSEGTKRLGNSRSSRNTQGLAVVGHAASFGRRWGIYRRVYRNNGED